MKIFNFLKKLTSLYLCSVTLFGIIPVVGHAYLWILQAIHKNLIQTGPDMSQYGNLAHVGFSYITCKS